jgi:hypothetical protein
MGIRFIRRPTQIAFQQGLRRNAGMGATASANIGRARARTTEV